MPQFNDAVCGKHGTVQVFKKIFIKLIYLSSEWQLELHNACVRGFVYSHSNHKLQGTVGFVDEMLDERSSGIRCRVYM